ncbi:MAG: hypothetical protein HQK78_19140, partial [Desulfobacterales bacterium]|nr:hypothetical protein [Desulfobacterales bacterium]
NGDSEHLKQILLKLVSNAVKFTEKGDILISVELVEKLSKSAKLKFLVKDTGIGIAKEHLPKIFDLFSQADGSSIRKYGGTGIGLTISKKLVEIMGGKIGVESELGKGSSFYFTIEFGLQPQKAENNYINDIQKINPESSKDVSYDKSILNPQEIAPMLIKLNEFIKNNNPESEEYFLDIKKYFEKSDLEKEIEILEYQINNFDFADAEKTLTEIAQKLEITIQ